MLAAKTYAALVVVAALVAGCSSGGTCGLGADPPQAIFELSCDSTDLTNVAVTGPCETDAGAPFYVFEGSITLNGPPTAGVCHVALKFATGFTYATDVTYAFEPFPDCNGHSTDYELAPSPRTFAVNNPSTTCVDAGRDGATGLDAAPDSGLESGIDGAPDSGDEE